MDIEGAILLAVLVSVWVCVPFYSGLGVTRYFLRRHGRLGALWAATAGLGIALFFVVLAGLMGWLSPLPECTYDCFPALDTRKLVEFIVVSTLAFWIIGALVGWLIALARRPPSVAP